MCLGTGRKALDSGPGVRRRKCATKLGLGRLQLYESASLLSYVSYCFTLRIHEGKNILILPHLVTALFMLSFAVLTDVAKIAEGEPLIQFCEMIQVWELKEVNKLLFFFAVTGRVFVLFLVNEVWTFGCGW